jgi:hypothetical protein
MYKSFMQKAERVYHTFAHSQKIIQILWSHLFGYRTCTPSKVDRKNMNC